jgi:hypothetical protein
MAANSPENPVPMITVSKCRGCIGVPAYADTSLDADCSDAGCSDAHIFIKPSIANVQGKAEETQGPPHSTPHFTKARDGRGRELTSRVMPGAAPRLSLSRTPAARCARPRPSRPSSPRRVKIDRNLADPGAKSLPAITFSRTTSFA